MATFGSRPSIRMIKKKWIVALLSALMLLPINLVAKKYPFAINSQREVYHTRSTVEGKKMLKVIASGKNADAAIERAMVDAVAALTFDGAIGQGEMESCPAVLLNGREVYLQNKSFFDTFFKKGDFLKYVEKVNSTYPLGPDNVKTNKGRRIQILLIVDWKGLAEYFKEAGFKTTVSGLSNY